MEINGLIRCSLDSFSTVLTSSLSSPAWPLKRRLRRARPPRSHLNTASRRPSFSRRTEDAAVGDDPLTSPPTHSTLSLAFCFPLALVISIFPSALKYCIPSGPGPLQLEGWRWCLFSPARCSTQQDVLPYRPFSLSHPDALWGITSQTSCSERVTDRKARGLQMEEIGCKCQTFFISPLSCRRK